MSALDPKFAKIAALWRSTQHAGERASARARAEDIAAAAGLTFDQALAEADRPPAVRSFLDGLDEAMERAEPDYRARRAAEQAESERQRLARRSAIIARYGSEEAALAPCGRERVLRAALGKLIEPCRPPWQRWTAAVDGCRHFLDDLSPQARQAIAIAIPLPTTFAAARLEYEYWRDRQQDLEDVRGPGFYGDCGLDLVAELRFEMVRGLFEHELPALTLPEVHARFAYYRNLEIDSADIEEALFRDLSALVVTQNLSTHPSTSKRTASSDPSKAVDLNGQIRAALDADPSRSDRDIARSFGCSPTTVGKTRRAMGLSNTIRSVQRGEQMYQMHGCKVSELQSVSQ